MARDRDLAAHLAHRLYAGLVAGPHHLPTVARRSGLSAELLYKLCRGERELLARHLPALYRGTQDLALFADLTSAPDLGLVVTEAQRVTTSSVDSRTSALELGGVVGQIQALVVRAEADGHISDQEGAELEDQVSEAERQLGRLRQVIRARQVRTVRPA